MSMQPNKADPYCLHGNGWLAEWEILSQSGCKAVLRYIHRQHPSGPYAYDVIQTVLALTVTNTSGDTLPFGLGFHRFFPRTPQTRLKAEAKQFGPSVASTYPILPFRSQNAWTLRLRVPSPALDQQCVRQLACNGVCRMARTWPWPCGHSRRPTQLLFDLFACCQLRLLLL